MLRLAIVLAVAAAVRAQTPDLQLWPIPQSVSCTPGDITVSSSFVINTNVNSATLDVAIKRYGTILAPQIGPGSGTLTSMMLNVLGGDELLSPATNYSYSLNFGAGSSSVTVVSESIYGAMAAMETLSQLFSTTTRGQLVAASCSINDAPTYVHRGFLVDSGRRFVPVSLLMDFMDSMSYTKMNVLHIHLSDWAGVRFEVPAYLELTAGLNGQYYTAQDAAQLVQYGQERGIRIVPEIDVPSHSSGFAPLIPRGLQFCYPNNSQLYNDPSTNTTLNIVKTVLQAVSDAFPDAIFHLGGDETTAAEGTKCDYANLHSFEQALQQVVQGFKKQPAVWNEVWSDPSNTEPNGALPNTIIQNWKVDAAGNTSAAGFPTLVSTYSQFYLDQQCCAAGNAVASSGSNVKQCYWTDISAGVAPGNKGLLMGGEAAMWSDMYCAGPVCPQNGPWSIWYGPQFDDLFSQSFGNLAWPRASAAGGSLWNYVASMDPTSSTYATIIANHNARLIARGSTSCPNGCACDWNSKCGNPYGATPAYTTSITLINQASYTIKINQVAPCVKGHTITLAVLKPGEQTVVNTDFIAEGPEADGDPLDEWFGGPGWMDYVATLELRQDPASSTYIDYVVVSQN